MISQGPFTYTTSSFTVTNATNASPIVITVSAAETLQTGDKVSVSGVQGNIVANNTPLNPTWTITVVDSTHFSLNGSAGNGAFVPSNTAIATDGVIRDAQNNAGIVLPQGSTVYIYSVLAPWNVPGGVAIAVPSASSASLAAQATVAAVPTTGATVQTGTGPTTLTNKEGTLWFTSGLKAAETTPGIAKIEIDSATLGSFLPTYTANRALITNGSGQTAASSVTNTELGYLSGVTNPIQTQINSKGDASTNTSSSVDSEIALFSGTGGKTLKRATGTGVVHLTAGVFSTSTVNLSSEVSGTLQAAQFPALTGDVTTPGASVVTTIAANAVSDAKLRQSAGLSLIGRTANTTGNVADIVAGSDFNILRRSGPAIGFGSIDLSQSGAVGTSILGIANGGTGSATQNFVDLTSAQSSIGGAKTFTSNLTAPVYDKAGQVFNASSYASIQAAIDACAAAGGGIVYVRPGNYSISSTLNIGNGTSTAISSYHGVSLVGAGGPRLTATTTGQAVKITWTGSSNTATPMLKINGPIGGVSVENILFDCASSAGIGIQSIHAQGVAIKNCQIVNNTGVGLDIDAYATITFGSDTVFTNGSINGVVENLLINTTNNNATGVRLGATGNVAQWNFNGGAWRLDATTGSNVLVLSYADHNNFYNVTGKAETGVRFKAISGHATFPVNNFFWGSSMQATSGANSYVIDNSVVTWNPSTGYGIPLIGLPTADGSSPPTDTRLWGFTDKQIFLGNWTVRDSFTFANAALKVNDAGGTKTMSIVPGSTYTANHTLTVTTGDSDRTVTLNGNPTLNDWFDQSVKTTASPSFAGETLTGNLIFSGNARRMTGDFANATNSNRTLFRNASTGDSYVGVISNSGTFAGFRAYSGSDPDNAGFIDLFMNGTFNGAINVGHTGTGTTPPFTVFKDGGVQLFQVGTNLHFTAGDSTTGDFENFNLQGNFAANIGANLQYLAMRSLTELTTVAAAATTTTSIQVPAGAVVFGVSVRVATAIPTASTFTVKIGTDTWSTAAVSVALNSTDPGTAIGPKYYASATSVTITPNSTPGTNAGRVRVTIHYYQVSPPTS
ncbi:MAG TPA: hypothetical protein VJ464_30700 [Blastocatellia bacterium]|nr:hypothetical protein [Blastocatellia bacterium]